MPYVASKYGVRGYIKSLRAELRAHPLPTDNVKFTTVYPYFVNTAMTIPVRLNMKFSALNSYLKPSLVAKEAIEGMRRCEENVIVPGSLELSLVFIK